MQSLQKSSMYTMQVYKLVKEKRKTKLACKLNKY
jgi:hypothetical protein